MREYDKIAELIQKYLQGDLYKLTMEFKERRNLHVRICYEDQYDEFIDYNFDLAPDSGEMNFHGHQCHKTLYKMNLDRDEGFENAICSFLCSSVL